MSQLTVAMYVGGTGFESCIEDRQSYLFMIYLSTLSLARVWKKRLWPDLRCPGICPEGLWEKPENVSHSMQPEEDICCVGFAERKYRVFRSNKRMELS
jgi:hypothetical protein